MTLPAFSHRYFRDVAVGLATILAGGTLSLIAAVLTLWPLLAVASAIAAAIVLMPRSWLRFCGSVLLCAAFFGLAVLGTDYGNHVRNETPLMLPREHYVRQAAVSAIFAAASLWLRFAHRAAKTEV